MINFERSIITTGGDGFIDSHVVCLFVNKYPDYFIINLDKQTYSDNLANLKDIEERQNYTFVKADISDFDTILSLMKEPGWEPSLQFEEGIEKTVRWYLDNQEWMDNITSGDYEKYYEEMYMNR